MVFVFLHEAVVDHVLSPEIEEVLPRRIAIKNGPGIGRQTDRVVGIEHGADLWARHEAADYICGSPDRSHHRPTWMPALIGRGLTVPLGVRSNNFLWEERVPKLASNLIAWQIRVKRRSQSETSLGRTRIVPLHGFDDKQLVTSECHNSIKCLDDWSSGFEMLGKSYSLAGRRLL